MKETNQYRPFYGDTAVSYVSGGYLDRIEYGIHADDGVTDAPAKVQFTNLPRCITDLTVPNSWCTTTQSSTTVNHWPDTPIDLICQAGTGCTTYAPTFFNRTRLAKITTYASTGSGYQPVDSWAFGQRFVPQGDGDDLVNSVGIMLRLDTVTHTGNGGSRTDVTLPAVRFDYTALKNRVQPTGTLVDELWRQRVSSVRTESGGRITVNYTTRCVDGLTADPATNTDLCYPVKWTPPASDPRTDYFYKYVIDSVVEGHTDLDPSTPELITGSAPVTTTYDYSQAAWKWVKPDSPLIKDEDKTFSEFRGAKQITTISGAVDTEQTRTVTTYYRGAGGTLTAPIPEVGTVTDHNRFAGEVFASTVMNGATKVSETVTTFGDPVTVATSATSNGFTATRIPSQTVNAATYDAAGTRAHRTRSTTTFNTFNQPTTVDDRGDTATASDNLCTRTTYAHETDSGLAGKHLVALPAAVETVATACDEQPNRPADVVSASKLSYDTAGRPVTVETLDPEDGDGYIQASTVTYDTRGRAIDATDAAGQTTTTGYDHSTGGLLEQTTTTNPLGHATTTRLDPILGVPVAATDANDRTTTGTYDALGRLTAVVYPQHLNAQFPSVAYEYTVQPNGLNAVVTKTISADGKRQHASAVLYDALLRPFQTQQDGRGTGDQAGGQGRMVAHTWYDSAGRVEKQTEPWWVQGASTQAPETPPADTSGHTTFTYDAAGRQTAQIFWIHTDSDPANEQWRTSTVYDGATTLQIPPMGATPTSTTVDARGRTTTLTQYARDPDTDTTATTPELVTALPATTTSYAYDAAGRLTGMTDHEGNTWSYGYDWAGRQVTATDPDAGTSSTTYDVLGRVLTRTNGNDQTLGYTYDALGRTTTVRDSSPTGTIRAEWEYDTVYQGVLTSATRYVDGQAYVTRTDDWDAAYRPTQTSLELPDTGAFTNLQTRTLSSTIDYTVDGQATRISYPAVTDSSGKAILGAETVTTTYDAASSMPSWMSGGFGWGVYVAASRFAADGRPLLTDLGNTYGAVASYGYEDGTKRLSSIRLDRERINGTDLELTYGYDPSGNVTSITDTPTNTALSGAEFQDNQCFSYDGLARMQSAWTAGNGDCDQAPTAGAMGGAAPYWTNYSYDVLGNRTKQTTTTADGTQTTTTYGHGAGNAGPHAVTTATTAGVPTTYTYDAAGNRASVQAGGVTTGYTWDAEGELVTAGDTSNLYDADGNRIIRTDANGTTIYASGQEIHIDTDGDVSATRYYSFAGKLVAIRTDRGLGDGVASIITDHHGTPIAAIPNGGHPARTAINRLYTDPFGATRGNPTAGAIPGDSQFLGKTRDATTGLTQIGARFYDEATGAFISVDPIIDLNDPQQRNAYGYANGSPVSRADPSGLRVTDVGSSSGYHRPTYWIERERQKEANAADQARVTNAYKSMRGLKKEVVPAVTPPNPCVSSGTCKYTPDLSNLREMAHGALDVAGLVPGAGEVADGLNGLWYLAEGDYVSAGLSFGGMVPFLGWGAMIGKGAKAADAARLVSAVDNEAARVVASQSIRQRGPVLSGAMDRTSGAIFFGQNTGVPSPLHGELKAALDAFPGPPAAGKGIPGTHSEINAINQGLYARPGSTISDFVLYSVRLRGAQQGSQIMMCPNCSGILNGAEDLIQ
ncbi:hypothetical protein GCM10025870_01260 [Agromyces marinus]|uniref:RHS repeat-associated core domain-containing protein n=1 Tax=Agromyces marinus TaxID=1389020 RepID=A0ABM8GX68_9MICO|nr:hypothetical protein GCM10025870_01260 [Agromyces marinus]